MKIYINIDNIVKNFKYTWNAFVCGYQEWTLTTGLFRKALNYLAYWDQGFQ